MSTWPLQDAKAKLSEVVRRAMTEGPQEITLHGQLAVVVVSQENYNRLVKKKQSFVEFMRSSPLVGVELNLERDDSPSREITL